MTSPAPELFTINSLKRLGGQLRRASLTLGFAALLATSASGASAGETFPFSSALVGEPEVGCIVTTGDAACKGDVIRGRVIPDGEPALAGTFAFKLPGFRAGRAILDGRGTRGTVRGELTLASGADPISCTFKGRIRTQGVFLPEGTSVRRFHTGTFEARGRCGDQRAVMKAIWSGSIGNTEGELVRSFDRFDGRLAGTIRLPGSEVEIAVP